MPCHTAPTRTDAPEEPSASTPTATRIGELGTIQYFVSLHSARRPPVTAEVVLSSRTPVTPMMEVPPQEPHGATSQKMLFFIVTIVTTSNLTTLHVDRRFTAPKHCFSASGTHFCSKLSKPQCVVQLEGLGKVIKLIHFIGSPKTCN
jgi:hypothetical protein